METGCGNFHSRCASQRPNGQLATTYTPSTQEELYAVCVNKLLVGGTPVSLQPTESTIAPTSETKQLREHLPRSRRQFQIETVLIAAMHDNIQVLLDQIDG